MMQGGAHHSPTPQSRNLGKYRLIARLGQGGMAEVFLAVVQGEVGFNKLVVVKVLKNELMEETEHRAMFLDEGRLAARLNHTNIVQTNEVQIIGEQYFIAMEYLDGQPLHRILRRAAKGNPMPVGWHIYFLCEVLAALEYAHELRDYDGTPLKVVHRDVTPHNVFVTYTGQVKLCDFGIAKTLTSSVETRAGVLKGKVNYMAPEQVLSTRVDSRADLFAVGVMLWEAATGARMWQGQTDINIMHSLTHGRIPRARDINPHIEPDLERIVERALAARAEDRYQSAAEFRRELENYLMARTERINPRRIGEWVSELFAKERANLGAVIQAQLTGSGDGSLPQFGPAIAKSGQSNPSSSVGREFALSGPVGPPSHPPSRVASLTIPSTELRALRPNKTLAVAIGAGGAASLFAAIVLVIVLANREGDGEVTAIEPAPGVLAGPRVPPEPAREAPEKNEKIELRVRATPGDADVFIDGEKRGPAPFSKDDREHELRVEAPGYEPETRKLRFERDVLIELSLTKTARAGGRPVVTRPKEQKQPDDGLPDLSTIPKKKTTAAPIDKGDDPWK